VCGRGAYDEDDPGTWEILFSPRSGSGEHEAPVISPRTRHASAVRERACLREQRCDEAGCVMVGAVDAIVAGERLRSGSLG